MNRYKWHRWFAWHPVYLAGHPKTVWLCWVERRFYTIVGPNGDLIDNWAYRLPQSEF